MTEWIPVESKQIFTKAGSYYEYSNEMPVADQQCLVTLYDGTLAIVTCNLAFESVVYPATQTTRIVPMYKDENGAHFGESVAAWMPLPDPFKVV